MSDEQNNQYRPHIEDQDFKYTVVKGIARLETKMDTLIGADGVEGRVPILEGKVENMNRKMWMFSGAGVGALTALKYIIGAAKAYLGGHP